MRERCKVCGVRPTDYGPCDACRAANRAPAPAPEAGEDEGMARIVETAARLGLSLFVLAKDDDATTSSVQVVRDELVALVNARAAAARGAGVPCPHIRSSGEGTHWCDLAAQTAERAAAAVPECVIQAVLTARETEERWYNVTGNADRRARIVAMTAWLARTNNDESRARTRAGEGGG